MFFLTIRLASGAQFQTPNLTWDEACMRADRIMRSSPYNKEKRYGVESISIINQENGAVTELRRRAA